MSGKASGMAAKDLRSVLFFMADLRKVIRLILSPEPAGPHTDSSLLFVGSSLPEAPREKKHAGETNISSVLFGLL